MPRAGPIGSEHALRPFLWQRKRPSDRCRRDCQFSHADQTGQAVVMQLICVRAYGLRGDTGRMHEQRDGYENARPKPLRLQA